MIARLALVSSLVGGCAFGDEFQKIAATADPCQGISVPAAKSCAGGSNKICGPNKNEDCCATACVPGGTFIRGYDGQTFGTSAKQEATVTTFVLDKYEVSVGRLRAWIDSGEYARKAGEGAHPKVPETGWVVPAWNNLLPVNKSVVDGRDKMKSACAPPQDGSEYRTWTETPGPAETEARPANCLPWHWAQAFCIWDGGRLPTEAEWNYAAAGGSQQRVYPWSVPPTSNDVSDAHATYGCNRAVGNPTQPGPCEAKTKPSVAGSHLRPNGDGGRWGHADLAGNVAEWLLDGKAWNDDNYVAIKAATYEFPCVDCVTFEEYAKGTYGHRVVRGGSFDAAEPKALKNGAHYSDPESRISFHLGFRCARDIKK